MNEKDTIGRQMVGGMAEVCFCSEYQSGGQPCLPGRCPNNPARARTGPTVERLLEALERDCAGVPAETALAAVSVLQARLVADVDRRVVDQRLQRIKTALATPIDVDGEEV